MAQIAWIVTKINPYPTQLSYTGRRVNAVPKFQSSPSLLTYNQPSFRQDFPGGWRYLRVGGRGQGLGAGKTRSEEMLENAAESHTSGARFVRCGFV